MSEKSRNVEKKIIDRHRDRAQRRQVEFGQIPDARDVFLPPLTERIMRDESAKRKTRDSTDAALDRGRAASVLMPAKPVVAV